MSGDIVAYHWKTWSSYRADTSEFMSTVSFCVHRANGMQCDVDTIARYATNDRAYVGLGAYLYLLLKLPTDGVRRFRTIDYRLMKMIDKSNTKAALTC